MDIYVYKTLSGQVLYDEREQIAKVIDAFFAQSSTIISTTGAVTIANAIANQSVMLTTENEAGKYIAELLKGLNTAVEKDEQLKVKGVPPLFPKELKLTATSRIVNNSGMAAFDLVFTVNKKASSRERSVPVLNAEMSLRVFSDGSIDKLHMNWKPIVQKKTIKRLALRINKSLDWKIRKKSGFPEVRYYFDPSRQFIVPLYRIFHEGEAHYFPASSYFL